MSLFLIMAFLFFIGSLGGWCLEVVFRKFFSAVNVEHRWINPGFCKGPYLPLYGSGLCVLYLLASLEQFNFFQSVFWNKAVLFISMAVSMTAIEYIAGLLSVKYFNVRLWDYRNEWGNIQGIICPKFSFFWAILGALYYFFIHPHILNALAWLAENLAFSFVIGMFMGIFICDAVTSLQLVNKLKAFAKENEIILEYETVKKNIRAYCEENAKKYHFFRPFTTELPLAEHLRAMHEEFEERMKEMGKRR